VATVIDFASQEFGTGESSMFLKEVTLTKNYDHIINQIKWDDFKNDEHYTFNHKEQLDTHKKFGFDTIPKSYNKHNTIIYQKIFTADEIDFSQFQEQLQIEPVTVSFIKIKPGNVIPIHVDTFYLIKKKYPHRVKEKIVRANIFLDDWRWGHFLQIEDEIKTHWSKNSGYIWDEGVIHIAANCGLHDRYTLQVSGFYNGT